MGEERRLGKDARDGSGKNKEEGKWEKGQEETKISTFSLVPKLL